MSELRQLDLKWNYITLSTHRWSAVNTQFVCLFLRCATKLLLFGTPGFVIFFSWKLWYMQYMFVFVSCGSLSRPWNSHGVMPLFTLCQCWLWILVIPFCAVISYLKFVSGSQYNAWTMDLTFATLQKTSYLYALFGILCLAVQICPFIDWQSFQFSSVVCAFKFELYSNIGSNAILHHKFTLKFLLQEYILTFGIWY